MNEGKKIAVATSPGRPQRIFTKRAENRSNCLYYIVFYKNNKEELINMVSDLDLYEVAIEIKDARNLLNILFDMLEKVSPKQGTNYQAATTEQIKMLAYEVYRDYDNWDTLICLAKDKLSEQIILLENAQ